MPIRFAAVAGAIAIVAAPTGSGANPVSAPDSDSATIRISLTVPLSPRAFVTTRSGSASAGATLCIIGRRGQSWSVREGRFVAAKTSQTANAAPPAGAAPGAGSTCGPQAMRYHVAELDPDPSGIVTLIVSPE